MGQVMFAGVSHYPPLCEPDERMAGLLEFSLRDEAIPPEHRDPESWPEPMRAEWQNMPASAGEHRQALVERFRRVRRAIDDFAPDVVLVWGDDQYENFREDIIPPFCVLAYDESTTRPWSQVRRKGRIVDIPDNVWGDAPDAEYVVKGAQDVGRLLTRELIERGFDMSYAYQPLHHSGLAHAFLNTVMFLDYDRVVFPYPFLPIAINCYGERVISNLGGARHFAGGEVAVPDPPGPSPARCFELGAATYQILAESPWRTVLVASSSWSHAFLTDHTWRLQPDLERDRFLYDALRAGDYEAFRDVDRSQLESAGQQEVLNWCALAGALRSAAPSALFCEFVESHIFNSSKCFGVWV